MASWTQNEMLRRPGQRRENAWTMRPPMPSLDFVGQTLGPKVCGSGFTFNAMLGAQQTSQLMPAILWRGSTSG